MKIITVYGELPRATEMPGSLTLSSALLSAIAYTIDRNQLNLLIEEFLQGMPPFVVSNMMFVLSDGDTEKRIYPAPMHDFMRLRDIRFDTIEKYRYYKNLKKIRYISENYLVSIIRGNILNSSNERESLMSEYKDLNTRISSASTMHVAISRFFGRAAEKMLFSNTMYQLHKLKIFFFVAYRDKFEKEVLRGIRILADIGIGGKRTWGLGKIRNLKIEFDYPKELFEGASGDENYVYLLSDVKVSGDMVLEESYYDVRYRRALVSFVPRAFLKKGFYYLRAGSVIKISDGGLKLIRPRLAIIGDAIYSGKFYGRQIIEIGYGLGILMRCPQ